MSLNSSMTIRYAAVGFWHDYNRSCILTFKVKWRDYHGIIAQQTPLLNPQCKPRLVCFGFWRHYASGVLELINLMWNWPNGIEWNWQNGIEYCWCIFIVGSSTPSKTKVWQQVGPIALTLYSNSGQVYRYK